MFTYFSFFAVPLHKTAKGNEIQTALQAKVQGARGRRPLYSNEGNHSDSLANRKSWREADRIHHEATHIDFRVPV